MEKKIQLPGHIGEAQTPRDTSLEVAPSGQSPGAGRPPLSKNSEVDAERVAAEVSLVHVAGRMGRVGFVDWLTNPDLPELFIPTTEEEQRRIRGFENSNYYSDATRRCEDECELGRNAYFYAGRAHPSFGDVSLAFSRDCEKKHTGSATRFDTGGIWNGKIRTRVPPAEVSAFVKSETRDLPAWRREFASFLAACFSDPWEYWSARPDGPGPAGVQELNDDWRAWTFEVRFREPQPILDAIAWRPKGDVMHALVVGASKLPVTFPPHPLLSILQNVVPLEPDGSDDPADHCGILERWLTKRLRP